MGPLWVRTFPLRSESGKVRKRRNLAIGAQRPMRRIHVETYRSVNWRAASPEVWERYGRDQGGDLHTAIPLPVLCSQLLEHKDRLIGLKCPLKPKDVWAIRIWLHPQGRKRGLALFNLAIDPRHRCGCHSRSFTAIQSGTRRACLWLRGDQRQNSSRRHGVRKRSARATL